ncbi:hypothetical protein PGT21_022979 [Puccinia graminis f. sp. tritici]|uniref:F-box domain-containing protein n=1 Tax=Puccinia graminis f. sp. tritici TaxID=56615 RepID=A0A5B0QUW0_PUCGR|nr:hypothetical protein PGT21_022979 [Puccinia graminis f. sp. tritici]KAA1116723.1 hypothetical protein PGTUg99_003318 [Puccinia graminis f. sp. tritici]
MKTRSQSAKISLSQLPVEIKRPIVEQTALVTERVYSESQKFLKLAMVDRSFHKLCSPTNWKELDLRCSGKSNLDGLINEILHRQANHVQSIIMGLHPDGVPNQKNFASDSEKIDSSSDSISSGSEKEFPAEELRYILEICTNLTKLEIRYEPTSLDEFGNFIIDPLRPITMMTPLISQLSNLTHIKLDNYNDDNTHSSEESLVKLLEKMVHLVYIRVDFIKASFPTCDFCECPESVQPSVSPLGVHLASLPYLKFIVFFHADCFNLDWSKLDWKGELEELTLHYCFKVSLRALHAFCSLFENSLVKLSLYYVPVSFSDDNLAHILPESERKLLFRLSKLQQLSIFNGYPIELLKLFREASNLKQISVKNVGEMCLEPLKNLEKPDESRGSDLESIEIVCVLRGQGF